MAVKDDLVPIVEPGSPQRPIIHPESGHADNVQVGSSGGTQPGNVAGIRRYLGLEKYDVKHLLTKVLSILSSRRFINLRNARRGQMPININYVTIRLCFEESTVFREQFKSVSFL